MWENSKIYYSEFHIGKNKGQIKTLHCWKKNCHPRTLSPVKMFFKYVTEYSKEKNWGDKSHPAKLYWRK